MFKKLQYLLILALCTFSLSTFAESREDRFAMPNELRIGWGDQLFETLIWHDPVTRTIIPENPILAPQDYKEVYKENYKYGQHLFLEYQRRFNHWFSLGAMLDGSGFSWNRVTRDGTGKELARTGREYCYNIVLMPTVRFTYFWHDNVNIYSGLGFGMDVNGGTETNIHGKHTEVGAAINLTLVGLSANYKRYFAAIEYGGMYAFHDGNAFYMVKSRMFTASLGVRF